MVSHISGAFGTLSSRSSLPDWRDGLRNDLRAINEVAPVVADYGHLCHRIPEVGHHEALVVDLQLPFTSSALITMHN